MTVERVRVLFVCTGNICRSPMAQAIGAGLARSAGLAVDFEFDSAGVHAVAGAPIDPRARKVLERAGYDVKARRARHVGTRDFDAFDLVLAMDAGHLEALREACPASQAHKLRLFLDFAPGLAGQDVPDPYYGDAGGFERVRELCEAGVRGLLWAPRPAPLKDPS